MLSWSRIHPCKRRPASGNPGQPSRRGRERRHPLLPACVHARASSASTGQVAAALACWALLLLLLLRRRRRQAAAAAAAASKQQQQHGQTADIAGHTAVPGWLDIPPRFNADVGVLAFGNEITCACFPPVTRDVAHAYRSGCKAHRRPARQLSSKLASSAHKRMRARAVREQRVSLAGDRPGAWSKDECRTMLPRADSARSPAAHAAARIGLAVECRCLQGLDLSSIAIDIS